MQVNSAKSFLLRLFFGKRFNTFTDIDLQVKYVVSLSILWAITMFFLPFGIIVNITEGYITQVDFSYKITLACIINIVLLRINKGRIFTNVVIAIFGLYCVFLIYIAKWTGTIALWIFAFPALTMFLSGIVWGNILSLLVYALMLAVLWIPGLARIPYESGPALRYSIVYFFVYLLILSNEIIKLNKDKALKKLNKDLNYEKSVIESMKDNLKVGMFQIDKNAVIQKHYSKSLCQILSYHDKNLTGKNLLDILSSSIEPAQQKILKQYFEMVFKKTHSSEMLEEINPISQLVYKVGNTEKILTSEFVLIDGEEPLLLCSFKDITLEKELEQQLQEHETAKQEEINKLYEVMQISPVVFSEFIEDVDYEFNQINKALKDDTQSYPQIIAKFYQGIHAIKSNAVILGLTDFSKQLHEFETEIKSVSSKEISFKEVFQLTAHLEKIMQVKDEFQKMSEKFNTFKTESTLSNVLKETLRIAASKVAEETHKKIKVQTDISDEALKTPLKRTLKEILIQLVKNSAYHGLEAPMERKTAGKLDTGSILVAVEKQGNMIKMSVSDDGKGLDFAKIKQKYEALHPHTEPDQKTLLNSIFMEEFSTASDASMSAGRGVGLSLVKTLVKENNGKISVNNNPGKGLTFVIAFPA